MIAKKAFCDLINTFEVFYRGVSEVEKLFDFISEKNFMGQHIDGMFNALTNCFFTDEELDNEESDSRDIKGADNWFDSSRDNVFNFIFNYCVVSNFGEDEDSCKEILQIVVDGDIKESYDCHNAEELYTIICRYLCRNCDETPNSTYYINCSCLR